MLSEDTQILEFDQYQKSDNTLSIIYVDLKSFINVVDGCRSNPENHPQ